MNQENLQKLVNLLNETQCGLIAINNYTNSKGEVSTRRINIGFKWENLKKYDLETLQSGVEYISSDKYTQEDWNNAVAELKESILNPSETRSKGQSDAYLTMTENGAVRYNFEKSQIYIMGLELEGSKKVVEEGEKKAVKSSGKTIAKNVIKREYLKQGNVRQFVVSEIGEVVMRGDTIELN
jgi:hypothetical protein